MPEYVVCIKWINTLSTNVYRFTKGKSYKVFVTQVYTSGKENHASRCIIDDNGKDFYYGPTNTYFVPLSEYRNRQLDVILA